MSCNHCSIKFSFFNKELGCANCGLSLCSKCLQQKCKIPAKGQGEFKVCRVCYSKILSGSKNNQIVFQPPDRFLKRLENLENPSAPPITLYRQNPKISALRTGLSAADQELVDRLEKLKEKQQLPPSDIEIRERLAKLKGSSFASTSTTNPLYMPDTRTDREKADSLLEQYTSEQNINQSHQSQDDLVQHLATSKGLEHKENQMNTDDDSDSEDEVNRITKKIVTKVLLDERCPIGSSKIMVSGDNDSEDIPSVSPELPWCVLCNNDAHYRCLDCGGDLYCGTCNTEVHKEWGDTDHRVVLYKKE